jgi:hypothetical protein
MRRFPSLSVASTAMIFFVIGCGGATSPTVQTSGVAMSASAEPPTWTASAEVPAAAQAEASFDTTGLPASPWADAPMMPNEAPVEFVTAWRASENQACAPLAPRDLGDAGSSARARVADFPGGWSVEFDQRGQPGLSRGGEFCARCGRATFGIAGTSLTPADLVGEDSVHDVPEPSFADGSHLELEGAGAQEPVAATIAVNGCVYQVWSFLGEEHVRELVGSLRMVDTDAIPSQVAAR